MKPIEIVFCGNSVYLCGLAGGLQQIKGFRVSMVDHALDQAIPELKILCPDVVILEAVNNTKVMVDTLHSVDSRLMVIGIYLETDLLEIFGDDRCFTASVDNLAQVIKSAKRSLTT